MAHPSGYSGKPVYQKLGIRDGSKLFLIAPENYRELLQLPKDFSISLVDEVDEATIVHAFITTKKILERYLEEWKGLPLTVWISWPKKTAQIPTDVTEDSIREVALPLGWVDVKVCAINETWSGLKLVRWKK